MAAVNISIAAGNVAATAIRDEIDSGLAAGTIVMYSGTMPANAQTAITTQTLLGTMNLSYPCGTVTSGTKTLVFAAISQDNAADASGIASFARVKASDGEVVLDVDVTAVGGGGVIELNTTDVVIGGPILINSFTLTVG